MIENPYGKFEIEGTITFPEKEMVTIKEIITDLLEKGIISSEILTEIINRLEAGETITEILNSLIEREVIGPEALIDIINRLIEEGIITPEMARDIIASLIERGLIPPEIAAELLPKPFPWGWLVAAGSLLVSGIIYLSTKKAREEK